MRGQTKPLEKSEREDSEMATVVKFTNAGSKYVCDTIVAADAAKYIFWGTGTTPAVAGDTGPETEGAEDRTTGTLTAEDTDHTDDTVQVVGTITSLSSQAITEAGVMTHATAGVLYCRATFDAVNVDADDSIAFTFQVKHDHS